MSLGQRVDALVEQGLLSEALTQLRSESSIPLHLSATLVHLQSHVGDLLKAQAAAELLLKKELDPRSSALCKEVIGRSLLVHGRSQADGLRLLLEARSTAEEKLGAVEYARYSCGYVDALLHRIGISEAASELPKLRKIVLVSGDAFALALMHILQAEVRTKQGQLAKASADLRMTHDLLSRQANIVLEGKWALASSARAALDGSVSEARALAEHAIHCADQSGSIPLKIPSLGTLAHVLLISGHLDLCERKLAEASKMARPGGATLIGLQDTRLQLLIARGSSEEADSFADKLLSLSTSLEGGFSYYGLWHLLTRVKWLLQRNRAAEAASLAQETLPRVERMADRNLFERMQLAAAEALGASGRPLDGTALLARTMRENPDPSLELVAEASRVAGCLAIDDRDAAHAHFARAMRIFHAIGQRTACADVQRRAGLRWHARRRAPRGPRPPGASSKPRRRSRSSPRTRRCSAWKCSTCSPTRAPAPTPSSSRRTPPASAASSMPAGRIPPPDATPPARRRAPASRSAASASATTKLLRRVVVQVPRRAPLRRRRAAGARLGHAAPPCAARNASGPRSGRSSRPRSSSAWSAPRKPMVELVKITRRIAPSNVTVLITGETGTGKEVLARALHPGLRHAARTHLPAVQLHHGAQGHARRQLFGYRRGAFTGAIDELPGRRSAPPPAARCSSTRSARCQPRACSPSCCASSSRARSCRSARPARSASTSASSPPPTPTSISSVAEGRFREDLFYRLNVVRLRVPPLRERREEIPLLVQALPRTRRARDTSARPIRVVRRNDGVPDALSLARQRAPAGQRDAPPAPRSRSPAPC